MVNETTNELNIKENPNPSLQDIKNIIPKRLFVKDESRFMISAFYTVSLSLMCIKLGSFIPLNIWFLPVWILYAIVTGTVWTGVWVIAHECGHFAFSNKQWKNDLLGFILHTPLLVPYFSW